MDLVSFIDRSDQIDSHEGLSRVFSTAIDDLGYNRYSYSAFSDPLATDNEGHFHVLGTYPSEWVSRYMQRQYARVDPVRIYGARLGGPFLWARLSDTFEFSRSERMLMDEAAEFGLREGAAVPVFGSQGRIYGFGLAAPQAVDQDNRHLSTLAGLCYQFHLTFDRLLGRMQPSSDQPVKLTPRERDVLTWCARGKSNWEIAEILGISQHAVDFHFRRIFAKLGVNRRIPAVLHAIFRHLIAP